VSGLIRLFLVLELSWPLSLAFRLVLVDAPLPRLVRSDNGFSDTPSSSRCGVELLDDARECDVESDRSSDRRRLDFVARSFSDSSWLCR